MGLSGTSFKGIWYLHNNGRLNTTESNINNTWNILSFEVDERNTESHTASSWLNGELSPSSTRDNLSNGAILAGNKEIRFNKYQAIANSDWGEAIFTEGITQEESYKIEGYLAHKWGLNDKLPSNHPYKLNSP